MALETELGVLKSVVSKLDSSLEKISEVSNSIGRLLAVHDERIAQLEKSANSRDIDIKDLHSRITRQTREIVEKISALEKNMEERIKETSNSNSRQYEDIKREIQDKVDNLEERLGVIERWRWYLIGGAASLGYVFGNVDVLKILK